MKGDVSGMGLWVRERGVGGDNCLVCLCLFIKGCVGNVQDLRKTFRCFFETQKIYR